MKGWYGDKYGHSLASRGIRTGHKMFAKGYRDYVVAEKENDEYKITVYQDEWFESPREWSPLGHMVCWHSRYTLGDEQPNESNEEWLEELHEKYGDNIVLMPIYMYDHSGLAFNTTGYGHLGYHGYFDSGQVGWMYVTYDEIKKEFGKVNDETIKKAEDILRNELETYGDYVNGYNMYSFTIEKRRHCESCDHDEWDEIESVGGFYGDWDSKDSGIMDYLPEEVVPLYKEMARLK